MNAISESIKKSIEKIDSPELEARIQSEINLLVNFPSSAEESSHDSYSLRSLKKELQEKLYRDLEKLKNPENVSGIIVTIQSPSLIARIVKNFEEYYGGYGYHSGHFRTRIQSLINGIATIENPKVRNNALKRIAVKCKYAGLRACHKIADIEDTALRTNALEQIAYRGKRRASKQATAYLKNERKIKSFSERLTQAYN